jgi:hypothetical protein
VWGDAAPGDYLVQLRFEGRAVAEARVHTDRPALLEAELALYPHDWFEVRVPGFSLTNG